ncbi:cytochrome O ubiquinol oxidase subunit II [Limimaricola cinnabarinus]|uniref:Cytochrome O ubiquinol oxidase subunit II n=1 Tax=Limimaricola cinnabarinus LL-001 TaxID=1337093 RepID=U3ADU3_9RHOB|nr:cytochrome O ubiquinol oxidase subunit II [Limimaricola cinnabarinus]GAD55834.1 cytochrome O ubiquinol oxidase subunit II [Limimaricola cinnabarinus LL-001]
MKPVGQVTRAGIDGGRALRRLLVLVAILLLPGCGVESFLDPLGPVAAQQRTHFWLVAALMALVVLPVLTLTPWLIWRYRDRGGADYEPRWAFSRGWEIALWGGPTLVVVILAALLWVNTTRLDPYAPLVSEADPLRMQVIGYDWKWLFIYPDLGIASVDLLAFPAGQPLEIELTSATVMQSFFLPALGSQVYAMGGMSTWLHLEADAPGRFKGENSQYNGKGFHMQKFEAIAMNEAAFEDWARNAATKPALDAAALDALSREGVASDLARALDRQGNEILFGSLPVDLFARVMSETAKGSMASQHMDADR